MLPWDVYGDLDTGNCTKLFGKRACIPRLAIRLASNGSDQANLQSFVHSSVCNAVINSSEDELTETLRLRDARQLL